MIKHDRLSHQEGHVYVRGCLPCRPYAEGETQCACHEICCVITPTPPLLIGEVLAPRVFIQIPLYPNEMVGIVTHLNLY